MGVSSPDLPHLLLVIEPLFLPLPVLHSKISDQKDNDGQQGQNQEDYQSDEGRVRQVDAIGLIARICKGCYGVIEG